MGAVVVATVDLMIIHPYTVKLYKLMYVAKLAIALNKLYRASIAIATYN